MNKGLAVVISAPSGCGKSTLVELLCKQFPNLHFSISCTTRKPRGNEVDGREYHFIEEKQFLLMRDQGLFAEWATVHGNYYGTLLSEANDLLENDQDVIFDIDVQGAKQLKANLTQKGLYIFILPPSFAELRKRLENRQTDKKEEIEHRLHTARQELNECQWYDAVIINDNLDKAASELIACYQYAKTFSKLEPVNQKKIIETLMQERF